MTDELAKVPPTDLTTAHVTAVPAPAKDVVVLARNPEEMAGAQQDLQVWAAQKVAEHEHALKETQDNLDHAIRTKIRTAGWKRQVSLAKKRLEYYRKAKAAIDEGYCIVPNFPMQSIAVRTRKDYPPSKEYDSSGWNVPQIEPQLLPEGEGRYVGPTPLISTYDDVRETKDGSTYTQPVSWASEFDDVDFPFKVVKPQVMSDLSKAMRRNLFDEIGVLPGRETPRGDPMVIGTIERREGTRRFIMSFLISWWVDTRDL